MIDFDLNFPRYTDGSPEVPVWCLTPNSKQMIHRFFDTSPLSPSGRYLAVFQMPDHDGMPQAGDRRNVVLVDLHTGEERVVWETAGWENQMGANINWGASDSELIFNDVDTSTWQPFGVVLDPLTGAWRKLEHTVYHVSPDGKYGVSSNLTAMRRTQGGYGVVIPDRLVPYYKGTTAEDGVWLTDIATGKTRLLISTREAAERTLTAERRAEYENSELYAFHTKWSPDGKKLMFSLRFFPDHKGEMFRAMNHNFQELRYDVFSFELENRELFLSIPATEWDKGGHHTNWRNDSSGFTMNLDIFRQGMRLCTVNCDGTGLAPIGEYTGSGHPSFHLNGRWGVTDCYRFEKFTAEDGTIPLRLFDLKENTERDLVRIDTLTEGFSWGIDARLDPHPVWCDNFNLLIFNAMYKGTRSVLCADMRKFQES
ncbi:MAG: hypothetical protein J6W67_08995 [Lentisphaeria bacterium]|nr:hypothetical protein [Lentisphaeria bacterium]